MDWRQEYCNSVALIGTLARDFDVFRTPSGRPVTRNRLAVRGINNRTEWCVQPRYHEQPLYEAALGAASYTQLPSCAAPTCKSRTLPLKQPRQERTVLEQCGACLFKLEATGRASTDTSVVLQFASTWGHRAWRAVHRK